MDECGEGKGGKIKLVPIIKKYPSQGPAHVIICARMTRSVMNSLIQYI